MNVYPFGLLYRWKEYSLRRVFEFSNWSFILTDLDEFYFRWLESSVNEIGKTALSNLEALLVAP